LVREVEALKARSQESEQVVIFAWTLAEKRKENLKKQGQKLKEAQKKVVDQKAESAAIQKEVDILKESVKSPRKKQNLCQS
jgi:hypothetical protein